jgi:hypothetical protein
MALTCRTFLRRYGTASAPLATIRKRLPPHGERSSNSSGLVAENETCIGQTSPDCGMQPTGFTRG